MAGAHLLLTPFSRPLPILSTSACSVTGYLRCPDHTMHIGPCSQADSPRKTCVRPPPPGRAKLGSQRSVWDLHSPCAPSESGRYRMPEHCDIGRSQQEDIMEEAGWIVPRVIEVCQRPMHPRRSDCHYDKCGDL